MGQKLLEVALLAFLPVSEIRGALPYGVLVRDLPFFWVVAVSFICNLLPFFLVMFALNFFLKFLLRWEWFSNFWSKYIMEAQNRFKNYEKWGKWGIMLFVGIPLPFTGVWTGSVVCFLAGLPWRESFPFILGGLVIATFLVSLATLGGNYLLVR
ncbi:MAG TPA: small multi-drug export protein [Candidatus Atribacteria bacterium]|nr:small multi-drug export protein [Candidatus Atribacteria bacterium]HQE25112.1 small multi-drug export protein [Candidatus Atribacteria bacterium]